jgi:hypothetical protein
MQACVETGAAGAAESLTRELPFLSQPLARAHAVGLYNIALN